MPPLAPVIILMTNECKCQNNMLFIYYISVRLQFLKVAVHYCNATYDVRTMAYIQTTTTVGTWCNHGESYICYSCILRTTPRSVSLEKVDPQFNRQFLLKFLFFDVVATFTLTHHCLAQQCHIWPIGWLEAFSSRIGHLFFSSVKTFISNK